MFRVEIYGLKENFLIHVVMTNHHQRRLTT